MFPGPCPGYYVFCTLVVFHRLCHTTMFFVHLLFFHRLCHTCPENAGPAGSRGLGKA